MFVEDQRQDGGAVLDGEEMTEGGEEETLPERTPEDEEGEGGSL
jgi:hypothetical protein